MNRTRSVQQQQQQQEQSLSVLLVHSKNSEKVNDSNNVIFWFRVSSELSSKETHHFIENSS